MNKGSRRRRALAPSRPGRASLPSPREMLCCPAGWFKEKGKEEGTWSRPCALQVSGGRPSQAGQPTTSTVRAVLAYWRGRPPRAASHSTPTPGAGTLLHTAHPPHSDEEKATPPLKRGESRSTRVSSNHWTAVPKSVESLTHRGPSKARSPPPGLGGHMGPEDFPHTRAWLPHPPQDLSQTCTWGFPASPELRLFLLS